MINWLSHQLVKQALWQGSRSGDTVARRKVLGLLPAPFFGPKLNDQLPTIYGFSPAVIAKPRDWRNTELTGYWFLESAGTWTPPESLMRFLDAGEPPIYIGFGSMGSRDPEATARLVQEAIAQTGQRAILLAGWGGLQAGDVTEDVYLIDSAPHDWLFPRMAAVVHHGGAGTTAAALRAGVPSIIIPFFGDQGFWGQRVADLGVGPLPISRRQLTVDKLAGAIARTVNDQEMRDRARMLGEIIRAEDGVAQAVAMVESVSDR